MRPKIKLISSDDPTIDIHCHQVKTADYWQILNIDTHQLIKNAERKANHSSALDKQSLEPILAINLPSDVYFSLGIHPWFIENQDIQVAIETLKAYGNHPKLLAIGECGLDKTIRTDLSLQTHVFKRQIELSERLHKPLIIHCVRAFNELIQIRKSINTTIPWIVHGFNNKPELARQLFKNDCYLSLGKALLNQQSNAANVLAIMPLERLFLETDDANDISISTIYSAAAKITGLTTDALRQQIFSNYKRVFLQ